MMLTPAHCVLKMLKSQWRGDAPKFICHVKGTYMHTTFEEKLTLKKYSGNLIMCNLQPMAWVFIQT